ncbi:hypothetical protein C7S14_7436 [Burkholderia cepacia]|nr:hypothetical protein C7S14_7436 [Burkholderia cepacia]
MERSDAGLDERDDMVADAVEGWSVGLKASLSARLLRKIICRQQYRL